MGGFIAGLTGAIGQKLEKLSDQDYEQKKALAAADLKMAFDPSVTMPARQEAWARYTKALGTKQSKQGLGRLGDLLHLNKKEDGQAGGQGGQAPPQQGQQQAPPPSPFYSPRQLADQNAYAAGKQAEATLPSQLELARAHQVPVKAIGTAKPVIGPDGKPHMKQLVEVNGHVEEMDMGETAPATNGIARSTGTNVTTANMLSGIDRGEVYPGADGQPLSKAQIQGWGKNAVGHGVFLPGKGIVYVEHDPNQRTVTVGNEVIAATPQQLTGIPQGAGTPLGPARTSSSSTQTFGQASNTTTRTPATPGPIQAPGQARPPAGPPQGPPQATAPRPALPKTAQALSGGPARLGAAGGLNTPQFERQRLQAVPIVNAATQILGDPETGERGLDIVAAIADNPVKRAKLGKAVNFVFNNMEGESKSKPGFFDMLGAQAGIPVGFSEAMARNAQAAVGQLGGDPELEAAFDRIMSSFGTVVGMRAATKGSASLAATRSLERELPIPGLTSFTSQDTYRRLANLTQEVIKAIGGASPAAYGGPATLAFYRKQEASFRKLSEASAKAPNKDLPSPGDVKEGKGGKRYRFKGGDPSQQANWEPI